MCIIITHGISPTNQNYSTYNYENLVTLAYEHDESLGNASAFKVSRMFFFVDPRLVVIIYGPGKSKLLKIVFQVKSAAVNKLKHGRVNLTLHVCLAPLHGEIWHHYFRAIWRPCVRAATSFGLSPWPEPHGRRHAIRLRQAV